MNHDRRSPAYSRRRVLVALAGLAGLGLAHGYTDPAMPASLNGSRVVMPATSYSQAWSTSVDGSGVKIGRTFTIPAPGGRSATAAVASKLTGPLVLGIGARVLATGAPWIAAGVALYDLYDAVRVKPDGSGGLLMDPGQAPITKQGYLCADGSGSDSPGACYSAEMNKSLAQAGSTGSQFTYSLGGSMSCTFAAQEATCGGVRIDTYYEGRIWDTGNPIYRTYQKSAQLKSCADIIDPYDPRWSSIGKSVSPDGKCPSGRGNAQPIDPDQAAVAAAAAAASADVYKQIMDEILDRQPVAIPKGAQTKVETVTPSKVQGPTTTTTGPAGVVEEATAWDFGRISQDLADDFNAGRWDETKTATTTKPDGTKETTTTKEGNTTPEEEAAKDGDLCKADPGRLGCIGLGEAPEGEIPKTTKDVSYAPITVSNVSGCPAPVPISGGGHFDYQPLCDGLTKARPLVILIGGLIAAGIIVAALKA